MTGGGNPHHSPSRSLRLPYGFPPGNPPGTGNSYTPWMNLLEAFGGPEMVDRVIDRFGEYVEADPAMRAIYPEDMAPGQRKVKLFFEQWMGGGPVYSTLYGHPRLRRRHFPFVIDDLAVGRWLRYMRQAMADEGVSAEVQAVIFEAFGPLARHMHNAGEDIPREPLGDAVLQ